jgi:hypothetical protein
MYDKEKIYDEKISLLMGEIIEICKENDIQMLSCFALKEENKDGNNMVCTTYVPSEEYKSEEIANAFKVIKHGYIVQKPFCMSMTITEGE